MCDKDHFAEDAEIYEQRGLVTRRQFGVLLAAGALLRERKGAENASQPSYRFREMRVACVGCCRQHT